MESTIRITPLLGSNSEPLCHLVEVGDARIVVNCGLAPDCDTTCYDGIAQIIRQADCIIVSSFSLAHFGAVFLFTDIPVYATVPSVVLGPIVLEHGISQITFARHVEADLARKDGMQSTTKRQEETRIESRASNSAIEDGYGAGENGEGVSVVSESTVEFPGSEKGNTKRKDDDNCSIIDTSPCRTLSQKLKGVKFIPIKFSQPFKVKGVTVCAYNAGYTIGNALFRIFSETGTVTVGYDLNHSKEEYLDGALLSALRRSSVLITNSSYGTTLATRLSDRNKRLLGIIKAAQGQIYIKVSFERLMEVLAVLSGKKVWIVSELARKFVAKVMSMVEWASQNALDILSKLEITYGMPWETPNCHIVVLVEGEHEEKYTDGFLAKLTEKDTLITIDHQISDFSKRKVCEFLRKTVRVEKERAEDEKMTEGAKQEREEAGDHWTSYKRTIFVKGFKRSELFPYIKRKRYNNDYGETFKVSIEKTVKSVDSSKEKEDVEEMEVECARVLKVGLEPVFSIHSLPFGGRSDLESFESVVVSGGIKSVLVVGDVPSVPEFLSASLSSTGIETRVCRDVVSLRAGIPPKRAEVPEEVLEANFVEVAGLLVAKKVLSISGNQLIHCAEGDPIVIGKADLVLIRNELLKSRMHVVIKDHGLWVNDRVELRVDNGSIEIRGEDEKLIVAVREAVYKFVAIV